MNISFILRKSFRKLFVLILFFSFFSCRTTYQAVNFNVKNHQINSATDSVSDESFMRLFQPYKDSLTGVMNEVLAESEVPLTNYRPESPLSNFICDLTLQEGNIYCRANHPDIKLSFSLINIGGIRASLPQGTIRMQNAYELMPFENEFVVLELSGKQVVEMANHIAYREGEGISGITFGIKNSKAVNLKVNGLNVDETNYYWMITSDYVANGGDGFKMLPQARTRFNTSMKVRDSIVGHLKKMTANGEKISAKIDGRLTNVE